MSAKKLRRRPSAGSDQSGRQEVEQLIEKRKIKDAFKQAKLCFHRDGSADNRRLLERVYLVRIEELLRGDLPTTAAEVARSFLDFGVTDAGLFGDLSVVLTRLGMVQEAVAFRKRIETPQEQAALSVSLADRAVLHPDQIPASMPDLLDGARKIRSALAALDADKEALMTELLQQLPRNSPWADWRYLVRGLAALRRGDEERTLANWDRLLPGRPAHRIAEMLRSPLPTAPGRPPREADLSRLEAAVFGEPVLGRIERLRRLIESRDASDSDWRDASPIIAALRRGLGRVDHRLAQRLTEILLPALYDAVAKRSETSGDRLVKDFTQASEPLWFDPQWGRFRALVWERMCSDPRAAADHWQDYADALEGHDRLSVGERTRMQAMVWRHIAVLLSQDARDDNAVDPWQPDDGPQSLRDRAVEAIERSLRLDPSQRATHAQRIELYQKCDQPEDMAAAARDLLKVFPDDVETLERLLDHHRMRDEPETMLEHVLHLRRLKPLDGGIADEERSARLALARRRALEGRWDEGRAEFARVRALEHDLHWGFRIPVGQAAFELKAGDSDRAAALIEEARTLAPDPAGLWLALAIEAARYELPAAWRREFEWELHARLSKKASGKTAELLAEFLLAYVLMGVEYEGRDQHVNDLCRYLERSSRAKYTERELTTVCFFLQTASGRDDLCERFVRRGLKAFPESPQLLVMAAELEMAKGPLEADLRKLRKLLGKAMRRAEAIEQGDPKLAARIKRNLLAMVDMVRAASRARAMMPALPHDLLDELFRALAGNDDER